VNWWGTRQLGHSQERTTALYMHVMEELEQHLVDLVDSRRRPLAKAAATPTTGRPGRRRPRRAPRHLRVVAPSPGVITKG